jgi:hypothetical protein
MAKQESQFLKRATKLGLEHLQREVEELLKTELSEAQRISTEEVRDVIKLHLQELSK